MRISRRHVLGATGIAGAALLAAPILKGYGDSGARPLANRRECDAELLGTIGAAACRILQVAGFAPSTMNSQPWSVEIVTPHRWQLGSERSRWLTGIDPDNSNVLLSMGAFLENLAIGARAEGLAAEFEPTATGLDDAALGTVRLRPAESRATELDVVTARRTLMIGHLPAPLTAAEERSLTEGIDGLAFLPYGSAGAEWIAEATLSATVAQIGRTDALADRIRWTFWNARDRDFAGAGITPESMEISSLATFYYRHLQDRKALTSAEFLQRQAETCRRLVRNGAGFLLVLGASAGAAAAAAALIEDGRRLERVLLRLRAKEFAAHPMVAALEETPWRDEINNALGIAQPVRAIIRIGKVERYPPPVSPRLPLSAWVKTAGHRG